MTKSDSQGGKKDIVSTKSVRYLLGEKISFRKGGEEYDFFGKIFTPVLDLSPPKIHLLIRQKTQTKNLHRPTPFNIFSES